MGNLVFISAVISSGLYASVHGLPTISENNGPVGQEAPTPLVTIQAAQRVPPTPDGGDADDGSFTPFPDGAQFETADAWVSGGRRYRLYGLQSCLRGTHVTISTGMVRDCGELNVIMIQAIIRDTNPVCRNIRDVDQYNAVVVCTTTTGVHRYDLATYLISQGWGFAAINREGQLVVPGYRIAEESARSSRMGLWASSDLPHPIFILHRQGDGQK